MSSTKLKPLYLMDIFRELSDEGHRLTVPELLTELEKRGVRAERKGIYRDIEALVEYGADIRSSPTGYYLARRYFSPGELRVLVSAVQAAGFISERRTEELSGKLAAMAGAHQAEQLRGGAMGGIKSKNDEVLNLIGIVDEAILARRRISFAYYKWDVNKREAPQRSGARYSVSPYALIWMQDRYYLVANLDGRDDLTHFRLDRMRRVRQDSAPWRHFSEVCEYRREFRASEYAARCLNMFGGSPERIRLRCANRLIDEVLDRFGEDTAIAREGEDRFLAVVEVAPGRGFLSWAAQFGADMEILSPPALREEMGALLRGAAGLYD